MKTLVINTKSWHYRFASTFAEPWFDGDLCSYLRTLVKASLLCALCLALATIFLFAVGRALGYGVAMLVHGLIEGESHDIAFLFLVIVAVLGMIISSAFISLSNWLSQRRYEARWGDSADAKTDPGFLATAYDSIKNKWCARIEFHNDYNT